MTKSFKVPSKMSHISSHSVKKTRPKRPKTTSLSKKKQGNLTYLVEKYDFGSGKQLNLLESGLGIELQEVQQVTKISHTTLESIENEVLSIAARYSIRKGLCQNLPKILQNSKKEEFEKLFMERYKNWKQTSNQ